MEKTIRAQFFNYVDADGIPRTATRGATVDLPDREVERGERFGAFADSETPLGGDRLGTRLPGHNTNVVGGIHTDLGRTDATPGRTEDPTGGAETGENRGGATPTEDAAGVVPSELTDEQIDDLTGEQLDDAVDAANIDASTGGELADGSLSADQKRAALKEYAAASRAA